MKSYSFLNLDASSWQIGQLHAPTAVPLGKAADINCTGGLSDLGTVRAGADNFASTRIQFLDLSARKDRLYRLKYLPRVTCPRIGLILCD